MFNLATGPNMDAGLLGTGPCDLIAATPRGGSWANGGLLVQLDWANLIRRPWPRLARGHGHGGQPTPEVTAASPGSRFRRRDNKPRPPSEGEKGGDSILGFPDPWFSPEEERRSGSVGDRRWGKLATGRLGPARRMR
jgi:hypothetical protein